MSDSESPRGTKRALLISIDEYRYDHWKLNGCQNDLALMYGALTGKFGFAKENVALLRNDDATRQGILDAFQQLVDATERDDIVVIHYAGHGSQKPDEDGDEPDGMDETIVPIDSGRDPDENRDITDDEIHVFLKQLAEKTAYTTLVFDCCHSGTITRDTFGGRTRSVESETREGLPRRSVDPAHTTRSTGDPGPSGWFSLSDRYVLIAGCADKELSAEKKEGPDTFGALTLYLSKELEKAGPGTTYRDVFEGLRGRVTANRAEQNPQMEGRLDREVFGVRDIEPMRYIGVKARAGDVVTLRGGAAHGLTVGSKWAVYPRGATEATGDALGEVEIASVGPVESEAKILEGSPDAGSIQDGCRAVETEHSYGDLRLRCKVVASAGLEDSADTLRSLIHPTAEDADDPKPGLIVLDDDNAEVCVYLIDKRANRVEGDSAPYPVPQLGALSERTWVTVGDQGEVVAPMKRIGEEDTVFENLEKLTRYRQGLALSSPDSALNGKVEMDLYRVLAKDGASASALAAAKRVPAQAESAGGAVTFEEGDLYEVHIKNNHDQNVYINLVGFDPAGAVGVLYPPPGANEVLAAGQVLRYPDKTGGDPFKAQLPDNFPFARLESSETPIEGNETLKLFVTTEEADFSFLESEAMRGGDREGPLSPVELLLQTATGSMTRLPGRAAPVDKGGWLTIDRPYVIRKKSEEALNPDGQPLDLGTVTLSARGLEGQAKVHSWQSDRAAAVQIVGDPLVGAFDRTGISTKQTIEISKAHQTTTRSVDEPGGLGVELRAPGPDHGHMLLATNEQGFLSWHFAQDPEERDEGQTTRGTDDARTRGAGRTSSFELSASVDPEPPDPDDQATRGIIGALGKKFIQELVFPLADPIIGKVGDGLAAAFEKRWRPYRLRTVTPENYISAEADTIDGELWDTLAAGRSLLLLHGAFDRAHTGFGALPSTFVADMQKQYEGRVFAFDHFTLSDDPRTNVEHFIGLLPPDVQLDLDVLCHARGGLVARSLAERSGEFGAGARRVKIHKVVFAGAPNAGTALADSKHLGALLDRYTNLLNLLDYLPIDTGILEVLETIVTVGKQLAVGSVKGMDGIRAMVPAGEFQKWLDQGRAMADTRYYALASEFQSSDPSFGRLMASKAAQQVFGKSPNDLVVPASSVYDRRRAESPEDPPKGQTERRTSDGNGDSSALFPIQERQVFEGEAFGHFDYFAKPEAREKIMGWLTT